MKLTIEQSIARLQLAMLVMRRAGREIQREIYAHPEIYGEKLTCGARSMLAHKSRQERQRLVNEYLADLTNSEE